MSNTTIVLLDTQGEVYRKLGHTVTLPQDFEVPGQCTLSWRNWFVSKDRSNADEIIKHGRATIKLDGGDCFWVQIESPDAKDFLEAIELTIQYCGGKVSAFSPAVGNDCSFVGGIRNDLRFMKQRITNKYRSLRQRLGFKIAS